MKVKKEAFSQLSFPQRPSFDQLLKAVTTELKITNLNDVEAIVKGNTQINDDSSVASLGQDEELIVYLQQ